MSTLVECIPNLSEGRRGELIDELGRLLDRRPATALLHAHPDVDHNRTVYTVVGEPGALLDALEDLYAAALDAVDLRQHHGVHPRLGAVDVCPFVPLPRHGSEMEDCVELARELGGRVSQRFDLPVFFYGAAAASEERSDLTLVRRGQFEGLAAKLRDPAWGPDLGPARPHVSGGATVIGARGPLIAYNVVLETDDLDLARAVAREVRASSGGLAGIKAMGVALESRDLVQVSMNVEDPATTPLHVAVDHVRAAAAERGARVLETELVGLMPLESLVAATGHSLQLVDFDEDRVLEEAIAHALL